MLAFTSSAGASAFTSSAGASAFTSSAGASAFTSSAGASAGISIFSVSGLPKSDSGSDRISLKIDSVVSLTFGSSSILTTYDGMFTVLSPIHM